ncbi:MAG TPA: Gfo/Idh/MocA family oxidoreductase [Pyrinomonadaceae bacterium]|jgi:glucose-fructose oxidoreductase|nr:Gfo/Idh/MocA family oxidoreductase [Pyrinomonadaceae bacterium]
MKLPFTSLSRRDFLRGLTITTAGLTLSPKYIAELLAQNSGRKLGIAMLGLGGYATNQLAPALRETKLCKLTAVVTGHPEKGEKWATDYNLKKENIYSYESFDQIANNSDIDIVYVVTPPALHPDFVLRAAHAGKHVISEKPMATSVPECDRMIVACKKAKVQLGIGYRLHYDLFRKELMRIAQTQEFGPFMKMSGTFSFIMNQPQWRVRKKLAGGGAMMDLGIYILQAAMQATNSAPVSVTAHEEPKQRPDFFNETEETIKFTLNFANGATCEGTTSFNAGGNSFRAEGNKGWFEMSRGAFSYSGGVGQTSRGPLNYEWINQQAAQMDDFAECVITGRKTPVPGEMGRTHMAIIGAVYEAARTGKVVKVQA